MWLLFCYFYSEHSCSGDMSVANHTAKVSHPLKH